MKFIDTDSVEIIDIDEVKKAHKGPWFEPGAMRFFKTSLPRGAYKGPGGTFFVTGERIDFSHPRMFTIRHQLAGGSIATWGDFCSYRNRNEACNHAITLAGSPPELIEASLKADWERLHGNFGQGR